MFRLFLSTYTSDAALRTVQKEEGILLLRSVWWNKVIDRILPLLLTSILQRAIFPAPRKQPPTSLGIRECISPLIQDGWWCYPHLHASFLKNILGFLPHLVNSHIGFLSHWALVLISCFMLVYRRLWDAQTALSVPLINSDFPFIIEQLPPISQPALPNTLIRGICTGTDSLTCCNVMSCCHFP